ncbi:MAG: hypothetical protein MZU97_08505 [Bacillus subtilis]|nr:hypothetical protein [Bacillus subtilis]
MPYQKRINYGAKFEPDGNYILHGTGQYDIYNQFDAYDSYRKALQKPRR